MIVKNRNFKIEHLIIVLSLILLFIFPYTGDDWAWGSQIGLDRLNTFFVNYNGRYLSNLLVILLTRSKLLKVFVMFIIYYMILELIKKNTVTNFNILNLLLILLMPIQIFRESVVWTSGFTNYVFPTMLFLVIIWLLNQKNLKHQNNLIFIITFFTSLILENMTILLLILSMSYFISQYNSKVESFIKLTTFKNKKTSVYFLLSTLLGTFTMFSNSAYKNIKNNTDSYRTLTFNILDLFRRISTNFNSLIFNDFLVNSIVIVSLFVFITTYLYYKHNNEDYGKFKIVIYIFLLSYSYLVFVYLNPLILLFLKYTVFVNIIISITFLFSGILVLNGIIKSDDTKNKLNFYFLIIIFYLVPLLIVTPIGPRNLFFVYIVLIMIINILIHEVIHNIQITELKKIINYITLFLLFFYLILYGHAYLINERKIYYTKNYRESNVLILPTMPHPNYFHSIEAYDNVFKERYFLFYNRRDLTNIKYIPYNEWIEIYKEFKLNEEK